MSTGLDSLKQQILTMSMVKGDSITSIIYSFILVTIIEHLFGFIPIFKELVESILTRYLKKTSEIVSNKISTPLISREKTSSIFFKRSFIAQQSSSNNGVSSGNSSNTNIIFEAADALIELVSKSDNTKSVVNNKFFYVTHHNVIELNPKIFFQINTVKEQNDEITAINFELFSYDLKLSELQSFIQGIVEDSRINKLNQLGNKIYYFDEISMTNSRFAPSGVLGFHMIPFFTNKSLYNVYGPQFRLVRSRVEFFMNHEDWYRSKGVPYTLGLLVYGPPGTGKTSCIKAIANTTKRHIVNVHLTEQTTKSHLQNLFYDDKLMIEKSNGQVEFLTIPCNKRIYVMEDIDCLSNIILDRSFLKAQQELDEKEEEQKKKIIDSIQGNRHGIPEHEKITLSFLLNLLDGVLETPGRILIMSSNYPDRIDKALIRPGRIDLNIRFGECDRDTVREMVHHAYDIDMSDLQKYDFADKVYTPAQINQILFNWIDDKYEGIRCLLQPPLEPMISTPETHSPLLINTGQTFIQDILQEKENILKEDNKKSQKEENDVFTIFNTINSNNLKSYSTACEDTEYSALF
jgi:ATPase family associated with various cellular activities (AAA)